MAKLFAEIDSDKHGRKASKSGDRFLRVDIVRGNAKIGTFGIYEVEAGTTSPAGFRVVWHPAGLGFGSEKILIDTAKAHSTAQ